MDQEYPATVDKPEGVQTPTETVQSLCRREGNLAVRRTTFKLEDPFAIKHPVLLPRDHPLIVLVVKRAHAHGCIQHTRAKKTLTEIRRSFWIPRGRSLTNNLIHHCTLCRRFEGAPFKSLPPPPLPVFRVKEDPAFSYTGVDFTEPLTIRVDNATNSQKVRICLFYMLGHTGSTLRHRDRHVYSLFLEMLEEICIQKRPTLQVLIRQRENIQSSLKVYQSCI